MRAQHWSRAVRRAWLPALLGLPAHPRLLARSLLEEHTEFVRFWPRLRATVPGWTGVLEGRLLFALAHHGPGDGAILEIGSAWGRSTVCLARGSKAASRERVYAVDSHLMKPTPDPWRRPGYRRACAARRRPSSATPRRCPGFSTTYGVSAVEDWVVPIVSASESVSNGEIQDIRLLFVDGSHTYEAVKGDVERWVPHVVPGGVLVFDDYFGTKSTWGVTEAVDELLSSGKVRPVLGTVGMHVWTVKI